ncbi:ribosomal protein S18 acetylase RimI-like enzyme [Deinobacterium chartae]|uniref:Ribosomal protein S18 acetylase RimI-like enzyme n=1 Tax=Deinobacterium chartae TaxID=521158 RepID=A0A841HZ74_9DEIO|nr:GNAT family N-acetyltransferase [Deinobacterium chartae]MBB6097288.1 ribosomal protein S18 acetylase RimI-like enzyme [Deinobacterium chartae]
MPYTLRPVVPDDRDFLLQVYASTRLEELAQLPWTPEQKAAFIRQQFEAQDTHYRRHYPGAEFQVIEVGGQAAGRLYLHRAADEHRLMEITLLPAFRGQGLGTTLIGDVLRAASLEGRAVRLHVEPFNPALRLYQRFGFRFLEERGVYWFLEWCPEAPVAGTASARHR